ncbi:NADP oxidoreductase, partial [Mycobacterium sp. ITM-2017-0098]
GICVPCRAGTVDLHDTMQRILAGNATQLDLDDVAGRGALIRATSRCGLGATAANPILTTLTKFPDMYQDRLCTQHDTLLPAFDLDAALAGFGEALSELKADGAS